MKKREKIFLQNLLLVLSSIFLIFLMIEHKLWFLVWISFAPVFWVARRNKFKNLITLMIIYAILINLTSLRWFWDYKDTVLYSSILIIVLFGLFFIKIVSKLSKNKLMNILSFPIIWTILVFVFSFNPLGSIWVNIAFFHPMMAPLIWIVGSLGITFLIVLFNSLLADYFLKRNSKVLITIIIILLVVIFCYNYSSQEYKTENEIKVALIQGNIDQNWLWRTSNMDLVISTYENLSLRAAEQNPDFIIWPEYSISTDIMLNKDIYNRISNIAKQTNSYLIFGTAIYIENKTNVIIQKKTDTLLVFSPNGELVGRYDSKFPMPFDETVVKGKKHNSNNILETEKSSITVGLCFEELKIRSFNGDSDFIISSVNNQFFDDTTGLELVSQFSRLIAAENKKYLVRSSNTGITQIVDPYGKVINQIAPNQEKILIENIYI